MPASHFLNPTEKATLAHLAKGGDINAQAYMDSKATITQLRAGKEGMLVRARLAVVAPITLASQALATIDGKTPVVGDVILVTAQADGKENGLYVAAATAWARLTDSDGGQSEKAGMLVEVSEGTSYGNSLWMLTSDTVVLGTDSPTFASLDVTTSVKDYGSVPSATLLFGNQPADHDTIGIGADTYQFLTAAGAVTNDSYIGVVIGGNAPATKTSLLAAINGTAGVTGLKKIDTVTAALNHGTESVVGDSIGTTVRIRNADAPGGNAVVGNPSRVLAEAITDAADVWNVGNVNMNTLSGAAASVRKFSRSKVTLTAAMITNGFQLDFPFVPVGFSVQAVSSTGGVRSGAVTDLFTIANSGIAYASSGAGAPALQATDIVWVTAWSA